jgi:hypothetical protein
MITYWIYDKEGNGEFLYETNDPAMAKELQEQGYNVTAVSAN